MHIHNQCEGPYFYTTLFTTNGSCVKVCKLSKDLVIFQRGECPGPAKLKTKYITLVSIVWVIIAYIYCCWKSPNSNHLCDHSSMDVWKHQPSGSRKKCLYAQTSDYGPYCMEAANLTLVIICAFACWALFVSCSKYINEMNILHISYIMHICTIPSPYGLHNVNGVKFKIPFHSLTGIVMEPAL